MRLRLLVPFALFAVAALFGWVLIWSEGPGGAATRSDEPEAEPELKAPEIVLAPALPPKPVADAPALATPVAVPPPAPAVEGEGSVVLEQHGEAPPPEQPPEPPDPRKVLQLPEHLQEGSEEEQRKYYVDLLRHHRGMIQYARDNLEAEVVRDDGNSERRAAQMRLDIEQAEAQAEVLREHLEELPE